MKNKFIIGFTCGFLAISLFGCSGLLGKNKGTYGKTAKQEAAAAAKIDEPIKELNKIQNQRLVSIGSWSSGVEYSLNKSTNQEPAVDVAKQINDRVKALANKPELKEQEEIFKLIDSLLTNAVEGQKMLEEKDKIIIKQQSAISELQTDKDNAVSNYRNIAQSAALKNDATTAVLKQMDSFWGFGAITYGIKKFITRAAIALGILAIIFITLRILSTTSPIAASIFAIFERIGSWVINILSKLVPRSTSLANFTPQSDYQGYKDTLSKIVDSIETVKSKEEIIKKSGSTTCVSMDDLSVELAKSFTPEDTERVTEAKKLLRWKL